MADENLKNDVSVFGDKVTSTMLPNNFSPAYQLYVINNDQQSQSVAGRANQAAQGAYDAQVRNDEQDIALDDHELRISHIEGDYISTSKSTDQSVQSAGGNFKIGAISSPTSDKLQVEGSENVSVSYKVSGLQVVTARQTGWTAATGTAALGAFAANQPYSTSATYIQAEAQAVAVGLFQARQRIKALEDALRYHGLIN